MLKKGLLYTSVFFISFVLFFVFTFPIDRLLYSKIVELGAEADSVRGNLFHIEIKNLKYKLFKGDKIDIKNQLFTAVITLDNKIFINTNPFTKTLELKISQTEIHRFLTKPLAKGRITAQLHGKIKKKKILFDGDISLFIKENKIFPEKNINVKVNIKNKNSVSASINSKNLNIQFNGRLELPLNVNNTSLKGQITGKIYGLKTRKNVFFKLNNLKF
ncbi:hypothetical protein GWK41_04330 [Persephonella atlantica]|uniref:Type II secretion system protein GspN n=1 Tax=Persephonella atlantica TaxID=2699429 RepID=A0ABS1GHB6_9AQUI|nr:hypothetical protein [Persephonella atlantica]MBK3332293.1 hypothetical protein [Persephonella atlantica]